ncbi:tumor necrosis factor receptor superfamily member 5 [Xiphophorus couchianus]|uniref:tumor necrosis factor receptor superfamily member 5 n=1 Tax=Xiphophorus couchianus TaxID=32473 RepID=UPI001015FD24|nr:tumor necrosis factor receptor superfamily member 3 [Xiphophorus couchianus]
MANITCEVKKNKSKDGHCCDQCPAGMFVAEDCNATENTKCESCPKGSYTEHPNYLKKCIGCSSCVENSQIKTNCTDQKNTVCECKPGFFSTKEDVDHCEAWTKCSVGYGVKNKPTSTNDTVCTPCEKGTYSNVTDFSSPCQPHFRCEAYGLQVKTPGTKTTNAICQECKSQCCWILPASLWAGLVLTILVVATLIFWRAKRRSYRPVKHSVPVTMVTVVAEPVLAPPELLSHCQESCTDCKQSPFNSDDGSIIRSISDSLDLSTPMTPLKPSVSFIEPEQTNCSSMYPISSAFCRSYSEPQEDEWCGT